MWPWGHAAVGYLLYTAYRRYRDGLAPSGPAALAVLLGTQFPDLVDKPLSWTFAVLPSGRSLGHSWLVAGTVLVVAWWGLDERERAMLLPFGVGWLSHGLADGIVSAVTWEPAYLGYFLWPLTGTPPYETDPSFLAHVLGIELTPYFFAQFILFAIALFVWNRDGRPGLGTLRTVYDGVTAHLPG